MFVRHKTNRSGSVSVQAIDKSNGYRVVKTLCSARDPEEVEPENGRKTGGRKTGQVRMPLT